MHIRGEGTQVDVARALEILRAGRADGASQRRRRNTWTTE